MDEIGQLSCQISTVWGSHRELSLEALLEYPPDTYLLFNWAH